MAGKTATPGDASPYLVTGSQVGVRDEERLIRSTQDTPADGRLVRCIGLSTLVRDTEATLLTTLDRIEPLRPEETELVLDDSPGFRRSRLYLEAVLRKTPIPATDRGLAVTPKQLLSPVAHLPAHLTAPAGIPAGLQRPGAGHRRGRHRQGGGGDAPRGAMNDSHEIVITVDGHLPPAKGEAKSMLADRYRTGRVWSPFSVRRSSSWSIGSRSPGRSVWSWWCARRAPST